MTEALEKKEPEKLEASTVEALVFEGDLARLSPTQRVNYYNTVCSSLGLNPATKPFSYIKLNGKLTLYALRNCTDQLMSGRGISTEVITKDATEDMYVVEVKAWTKDGRQTTDIGAVPIRGLAGDNKANAMMKAFTKAKRRAVLSLVGLSFLDETEVETIPSAVPVGPPPSGVIPPPPVTGPIQVDPSLDEQFSIPQDVPLYPEELELPVDKPKKKKKSKFKNLSEEDVERLREGFRRSGLKGVEIKAVIDDMGGGRPAEEWTVEDMQRMIEFLGDAYPR